MHNHFGYAVYRSGSWNVNLEMRKKHLPAHNNNQRAFFLETTPAFYVSSYRTRSS